MKLYLFALALFLSLPAHAAGFYYEAAQTADHQHVVIYFSAAPPFDVADDHIYGRVNFTGANLYSVQTSVMDGWVTDPLQSGDGWTDVFSQGGSSRSIQSYEPGNYIRSYLIFDGSPTSLIWDGNTFDFFGLDVALCNIASDGVPITSTLDYNVPEPSTGLLIGLGLVFLARRRSRRVVQRRAPEVSA